MMNKDLVKGAIFEIDEKRRLGTMRMIGMTENCAISGTPQTV